MRTGELRRTGEHRIAVGFFRVDDDLRFPPPAPRAVSER